MAKRTTKSKNVPTVDPIALIFSAVIFLASRCDGASSYDGEGFSKADRDFGHAMAAKARENVSAGSSETRPHTFSPKMLHSTLRLCKKYHKQLDAGGFELPDVSLLPELPPPAPNVAIEQGDDGVVIRFGKYNPNWNDILKYEARRNGLRALWNPDLKAWTVEDATVDIFAPMAEMLNAPAS